MGFIERAKGAEMNICWAHTKTYFKQAGLIGLLSILCLGAPVRSEVVTVRGQRYYRVFGKDFTLDNDRLSDNQVTQILDFVQMRYEQNLQINTEMVDIWETLDDVYEGSLYGRIMLTIFDCYLNQAFSAFYTPLENDRGKRSSYLCYNGFLKRSYTPSVMRDGSRIVAIEHVRRKIFPGFDRLASSGLAEERANIEYSAHCTSFLSDRDIRIAEDNALDGLRRKSPVGSETFMEHIVKSTVNTLEGYISELRRKIHPSDPVIQGFDERLIKIANQYEECSRVYHENVAKSLTKNLSEMCWRYARNETSREEIKANARRYEIELHLEADNKKRF